MIAQILNIWKSFQKHKVKYITIGGFAVNIYGYNRNTGDLDILIEEEIDLETVYSFDMSNLKRIRFLEVLLEDLKHENIFSIDLRNL